MDSGITPLTPDQLATAELQVEHEGYFRKDLIGLDQFVNVLTGGSPDETISSRSARWAVKDKGVKHVVGEVISHSLDLFEHDHGAEAEAGDLERAVTVAKIEESTGDL